MKKSLLALLLALSSMVVKAAAPNWSVIPGAYTYNMTITAVLNVNCTDLSNPSNILGAFINGEERGVAISSTVVNDQFIAMLTVYSNVASGDTVLFKIYDAATDQIVDAKTTVLFQDDAVYGTPTVPFNIVTNTPPTDLTLSNEIVQENIVVGSSVGVLKAIDSDLGTYNYSLVTGGGSNDNSSFAITTDQLNTNSNINYEAKSNYLIRVKADDGTGCAIEKELSISVVNVNDVPTDLQLSNNRVDENIGASDEIGFFTSTDEDLNQTFTYSLVAGTGDVDNSFFAIQGDKLVANQKLDFETKSTYEIRVRTTDSGGASFESTFIINLNDINDAPTSLTLSVDSLVENNKIGQTIGLLSSVDQDAGDTHTYAFKDIPGSNNDKFFIVGNQLRTSVVFDFESLTEYFVYVSTFDSKGAEAFGLFTIKVLDGNDAPSGISITNSSIAENRPIGTFIGTLTSVDIDLGQTHLYSLVSGVGSVNNNSFTLKDDSLFSNEVFDVSVKSSYSLRVQTDDQNGATYSETFEIFVKDINNDPTDIFLDNALVAEDATLSSVVGLFTAADADLGDGHQFKLVSGTGDADNSSFIISSNTLKTNTLFDFETKNSYTIRVEAKDGFGGSFEKQFEIKISNGNDLPTDINLSNLIVTENLNPGIIIGDFTTVDKDVSDIHTYKLITSSTNDNGSFVINGSKLLSSVKFDFETKNLYFISVVTDDGNGGSFEKQFSIQIKDTNDAPVDILITSTEIEEDQIKGTLVGVLSSEDVDLNNTFTYVLTTGAGSTDNSKFFIDGDSLKSNEPFDLPLSQTLKVRIKSTDNSGLSTEKAFVISVLDINDSPTNITLSASSLQENNLLGHIIGTFSSTDPDLNNTFSYSLVSGTGDSDNDKFLISGQTLKANAVFDFESNSSYNIRVSSTDNFGGSFEKQFTITIEDANDAPTDLSLLVSNVAENMSIGTVVTKLTTTDQDVTNTHFYSFENLSGNSNDLFIIFGDELRTNTVFNFEVKNQYIVALKTTDPFGVSFVKQFTISIDDANDAPIGLSISDSLIFEKEPIGTILGTFSTQDPDAVDSHTYSLVSGALDNSSFNISNGGLLSAKEFDFNLKSTYAVLVRSTDASGLFVDQKITVQIKNVNGAPTQIILSAQELEENVEVASVVASLTAVDEDLEDTHTFKLVSGNGAEDNSKFKIESNQLITNALFDFEQKSTYNILLQVADQEGNTFDQNVTIKVNDINEAPIAYSEEFSVSESAETNYSIGYVKVEDEDLNQTITYRLEKQKGEDSYFKVDVVTGEITLLTARLNYEEKDNYEIIVVVSDNGNPVLRDTVNLVIYVEDEIEGFLPTVDYVSPNGDNINDTWVIKNIELYDNYKISIFNAIGTLLYSVNSGYDNTWNGLYNGKELPTGSYYYIMSDNDDSGNVFKGTISLVR